jgi:hypothetical protein
MEACRSGGAKKGQQWTEGSETGTEKIGRNYKKKKKTKKHKNRLKKKSNTAKHQNKYLDGGGRGRGKGMGGTGSRDIR